MNVNYLLLLFINCILSGASVEISKVPTTTRVYDLPGTNRIRIVEGDDLWKTKEESLDQNLNDPEFEDISEDSNAALKDFLNSYAEKVTKNKQQVDVLDEEKEGKKHWNLMNLQQHNHPYEDNKGWVTLEPIPWSLSKISKWQSKSTTTEEPWADINSNENRPLSHNIDDYSLDRLSSWNKPNPINGHYYGNHPEGNKNKYQVYYMDDRSEYSKPSATYGQTVHLQTNPGYQRYPVKESYQHKHNHKCNHYEDAAIITDGRPPNFPSSPKYYQNRRTGTELLSEHPQMGDGEWVLLSTTKGYKTPKSKQRSLDMNSQSVGARQSVSLTVLPPLKNSKINMTTSHGGLLQVDSSFETVEQAQRKYIKLQKMKDKPKKPTKPLRKKKPTRDLKSSTIATIPRGTPPDSSAVLAAVGAGMIPATMAMLVPFAMNGRRRRRDILLPTKSNVQITLPRYF